MKIIFLDRDGVISRYTPNDYVKTWREFSFLPHAAAGCKLLTDADYRIVLISNQGGIRKGLFTEDDLADITARMIAELRIRGTDIHRAYYCIHTEEENCSCRKPKTGLFLKAEEELGPLDFSRTFFIGDTEMDVQAGKNTGSKTILVLSGKIRTPEETAAWKIKPDFIAKNLVEAAKIVLKNHENP